MIFLQLALKSLRNRLLTTVLTLISIGLSMALLLSVEKLRSSAEDGFTQTISGVDLIVGARTSPLSLLLYTVFNIGNPTNNVSWKTYEHFKSHAAVEWTIPYSLGDSHRGFRVVGTTPDFFTHYRYRHQQALEFRSGQSFQDVWDVVLGFEVAQDLKYKLGDSIVVAHGVTKGPGILFHDDKPFKVVGILKRSGTALDRSVYVSLQGIEAMHSEWKIGVPPASGIEQITSFFLRTKSRIETLRLQREINTYQEEALVSIIPGVALAELWRNLSYVEQTLKLVSVLVILVGFFGMLISILTSLNERRREMAILRSLGLSARQLLTLFLLESSLLSLGGVLLGAFMSSLFIWILGPWLASEFGVFILNRGLSSIEWFYLAGTWFAGLIIGLLPAFRAYRLSLKDGLSQRL